MKKLLVLALSAMLIFSACTGGGGTSSTAPSEEASVSSETASASEEPASTEESAESQTETTGSGEKITIFQSKVEIADQLEKVAADYSAANGVEVEVWGAAGDDYRNQLQARMASGEGPVIFSLGGGSELTQFRQYVTDLTSQPYVANISPGLALEEDGTVFGVPYGIEGYGLVVNKDLTTDADFVSYDSLSAMFDRVSGEGKAPLLLSSENYFLIAHILNTPFALQPDYEAFIEQLNAGEVKMADTAEFQEFGRLMEMIREKSTNPLEITYDNQIATFADGEAAAIHQGNWAYGMFADYDVTFEMTMQPLPLSGNDKIAVGVGSYWCINVDASEAQQAAAQDFFNYLFNTEDGMNILINDFGFIPPFSNANYNTEDPLSQVVFEYASAGNSLPWTYTIWPQGIIDTALAPATQTFFSDPSMTGEQFIASLDEAWANAPK